MALCDALMPWGWHSADLWTNVSPGLHTMHRWLSVNPLLLDNGTEPLYLFSHFCPKISQCICMNSYLSFALIKMHWSSSNMAKLLYPITLGILLVTYCTGLINKTNNGPLFVNCVISFSSTSPPRCVGLLFVVWLSSMPRWTLRGMTSLWSVIL